MPQGLVVLGIVTVVGGITAFARFFDAFVDPAVASLSDRCNAKSGRCMPFLKYAALPLAAVRPATPKRYRADMCATLRRQIAFDRTPYYIVASCFAEQSNIQGAVAQLVERFVRIEEVAVSTTVSSTRPSAFIPPQRVFSFVFVEILPSCVSRG